MNDASGYKNITGVYSTTANGTYGVGSEIGITVEVPLNFRYFSLQILPHTFIDLETGDVDRAAVHERTRDTQFSTSYVDYRYTVQEGDFSDDLDWKDNSSLHWAWDSSSRGVQDATLSDYNCKLANPGQPGSLSYQSDIRIDGFIPNVTSISSPDAPGAYVIHDPIRINVTFSEAVTVTGTPLLRLETGATDGSASYRSGSGTPSLMFGYTVMADDYSSHLNTSGASPFSLNGGSIEDGAGNAADLDISSLRPGDSLAGAPAISVNGSIDPFVLGAASLNATGIYGIGDAVLVQVNFSKPVGYSGSAPVLYLSIGGAPKAASYASGNDTAGLVFAYTVQAGDRTDDLDYYNKTALYGAIKDRKGDPANLTLPTPGSPGSLSHSSDILVDPAVPQAIAAGSARDGAGGFEALSGPRDVDTVRAGDRTYAAVASHGDDAVQLVRVHESGALEAAGEARHGQGGFDRLDGAHGIDAFRAANGSAYAIVASNASDGVQLVRIREDGAMRPADSLGDNATLELGGAQRVAVFNMGGHAHALVTARADDGVQLIRIRENGTLEARGSLGDNATLELDGAHGVAAFRLGGHTHALVAGHADDGVQLIRVHENATLEPRASLADNATLALAGPRDIAAFNLTGRGTHALVSSELDDGIQLIRIYANGTLEPRESATDGARGYEELDGALGVAALRLGDGSTYAAVASRWDDGVQLVRVRASDGALHAAGSAADNAAGFDGLGGAFAARALDLGGRSYAIVASAEGNAVQMIELSPVAVANVTSAAGGGPHLAGAEINVTVAFDSPVVAEGPLELRLNSGGAAHYLSGSGSARLVFGYTVGPGEGAADLDYAGINALSGGGTIADAATGLPAGRALPPPGSGSALGDLADIAVDARGPSVASVAASADGAYGAGRTITVTVAFDERVVYSGDPPVLRLNVSGQPRAAAYASGDGTTGLVFEYTTRAGDRAYDLDYRGTGALSGTVADLLGNPASLALPPPGAPGSLSRTSDVLVDHALAQPVAAGSAHDGPDFGALSYSLDVDTIVVGGRTYAVVASHGDNAVQLVRVHENGTLKAVAEARHNSNFTQLHRAEGIDAFTTGAAAYAIVAARDSHGAQLIRILENGTLRPADSLGDSATLALNYAQRVAVFNMGGHAHALVTAFGAVNTDVVGGAQLIRIHANGTLEPRGSLAENSTHNTGLVLSGAYGVAAFRLGGHAHALVGGYNDDGVQLIRVHANGTLEPRSSLADDGIGGTLELDGPRDIAAFNLTGRGTHALVASEVDDGIQLIRIHENGTLEAVASAAEGDRGFDELDGPFDIDAFELGGSAYAAVASRWDSGVQLVRIREDGVLFAAGSAANGADGFDGLHRAHGIRAFELGGRTYAIAASAEGSAVQLIEMSPAAVASVTSAAADGPYISGAEINVTVTFDRPVRVAGEPTLKLNSGGSARYISGNNTAELVLRYAVQDGDQAADLDYTAINALSPGGGGSAASIAHAASGLPASLYLPLPGTPNSLGGSKDIAVDARPPLILSASASPAHGAYGEGGTVEIAVRFDKAIEYSGDPPVLSLNVSESARPVPYASGDGTDTLVFHYTVGPGDRAYDLDYRGTGALSGTVADLAGNPASLALPPPGAPGSLSRTSDVLVDHALAQPVAAGSAHDNENGFHALSYSLDVDTIVVGGRTYAVVASHGDNAVQLVRVHENGTLKAVAEARHNSNFTQLHRAEGIDAFTTGAAAYAIVAARDSHGAQLIRILENGTLRPADSLGDSATLALNYAQRVAVFNMGGHAHALVTAFGAVNTDVVGGAQLIRIHANGTLEPRGSLAENSTHNTGLVLSGAYGVAAFRLGGHAHALVGGYNDDGVQLIRVHANGTLEPRSSLADDGIGGTLELDGPRDIAAFNLSGRGTHALVASEADNGVQLIRIHENGTLEPRGSATDGARGFDELVGARGVDAFSLGGSAYAAVASRAGDGVQMIRIRASDGALFAAGSAANGTDGFAGLHDAHGVRAFELGGRAYAIVASSEGHSVQLIEMSPAAVASVTSAAADAAYLSGAEINVTVAFDRPVRVTGEPALKLNSGGSARYISGNNTAELVFRYTVQDGDRTTDLDYTAINALSPGGGGGASSIAHASSGLPASLYLPPPGDPDSLGGSKDIAVDARLPSLLSVSASSPDGVYAIGRTVDIEVAFDERVAYPAGAPPPVLYLDVGGSPRPAPYASGNGTDTLVFRYTVGPGDRTDDLAYRGTGALSGSLADLAGNPADLTLPPPGAPGSLSSSSDILVDHAPPRLFATDLARDGQNGFDLLGYSLDVDTIVVGGRTYAVVASLDDAVQLIRVHENGTLEAAGAARHGYDGFDMLADAYGIDAFAMGGGGDAYAIVASDLSDGVQLIQIYANDTLKERGSLDGGHLELANARRVAAFGMSSGQHALVASEADHGVQLVRIRENALEAIRSLDDSAGDLELLGAYGVAAFRLGGAPHALVGGYLDDGVQLIRIHENGTLKPRGSLDDTAGDLELLGARDIAAFNLTGRGTHALVASEGDDGIQLIRIYDNGTLEAVASAADDARGFDELDGARDVDAFELGGGAAYAAVASREDDGVQLVRIRAADGALFAAGSAAYQPVGDFNGLDGAFGIRAFELGGCSYVIVASAEGSAVQLIEISQAAAAYAAPAGPSPGGAYRLGDTLDIAVVFNGPVHVEGRPELLLNSSGSARYISGGGSAELVFRYTVQEGEYSPSLDYNGSDALSPGAAGSITANGMPARLELPPPGSEGSLSGLGDIRIDGIPPSLLSVSASWNGVYGIGDTVRIAVRFDEPVAYSGAAPVLYLNVSGTTMPAPYASGNGTAALVFAYVVGPGDLADDLAYAGTDALSGTVADLAGNPAGLELPPPGATGSLSHSSDVLLDHALPRLITGFPRWSPPGYPEDVHAFSLQNRTYVASSAPDWTYGGILFLARVHENGNLEQAARITHGGSYNMNNPRGVDVHLEGNGSAYMFAASVYSNGVQLINVREDASTRSLILSPENFLSTGATQGATRVAAFEMGNYTHALVAAEESDSVQLVRVNGSGKLEAVDSLFNSGSRELDGAHSVAVFDLDGDKHAIVSAKAGHGIQLIRILGNGTLVAKGSLSDAPDTRLDTPYGVAAFEADGLAYVLVASEGNNGVQLVRVHENGTLRPAGSVPLADTRGVDILEARSGGAYAVATSNAGHTVNLYRIHAGDGDGALFHAGSARVRNNPNAIDVFDLGGRPYAVTASGHNPGIQLVRLSAAAAVSVNTTAADSGLYGPGDAFNITVAFDYPVRVAEGGAPALKLNSGGAAEYASGSGTAELVFRYTVQPGEGAAGLDYTSIRALSGSGAIKDAGAVHLAADTTLPAPGSGMSLGDLRDISVDGVSPTVVSVYSGAADREYGPGEEIAITVAFDEDVIVTGGTPLLALAVDAPGAGAAAAQALYESGNNTELLNFLYTVRNGDRADDLDYAGVSALVAGGAGGAVRDSMGNDANLTLPEPGSPNSLGGTSNISVRGTTGGTDGTGGTNGTGGTGGADGGTNGTGGTGGADGGTNGTGGTGGADGGTNGTGGTGGTGGAPNRTATAATATADAAFVGPNAIRIEYSAPLGAREGHDGPVYGAITAEGAIAAEGPLEGGVSGLGTAVHAVRFGGGGVAAGQAGEIALRAGLVGAAPQGGALYEFANSTIAVRAGETARTVAPSGQAPVAWRCTRAALCASSTSPPPATRRAQRSTLRPWPPAPL